MQEHAGRVVAVRRLSKRATFVDLQLASGTHLELLLKPLDTPESFTPEKVAALRLGDTVLCSGCTDSDGVFLVASFTWQRRWSEEGGGTPFTAQPAAAQSTAPHGAAKGEETAQAVCKHFLNTGTCTRGDACSKRHVRDAALLAIWLKERRMRRSELSLQSHLSLDDGDVGPQGSAIAVKSQRASIFADWLVQQFGAERLRMGNGVVDVAGGGAGGLAFYLSVVHDIPVTVVDPRPPHLTKRQSPVQLARPSASLPRHTACLWEPSTWDALAVGASLIVGMHPDGATEGILDAAQAAGIPFACVPCCVFPGLRPRRMADGRSVRTREEFCSYLVEKCGHKARLGHLPFEGANTVVWSCV